jgi:hypothetical protein
MPASVVVASVAVWLITAANGLTVLVRFLRGAGLAPLQAIGLVVGILVIIGFARRDRLAWQWGRLAALVGFAFNVAFLIIVISIGESVPVLMMVVLVFVGAAVILRLALYVSLTRRSAREYFRLFCPECGGSAKAADFWYDKARCKSCGHVW